MMDEEDGSVAEAVTFRSSEAPAPGAADSLLFRIVGAGGVSGPVMLHGSFNVGVTTTGRYSGDMPMPVRVVAVSRETGRVHHRLLVRMEDQPPIYRGEGAPPAVVRLGPGGGSEGISETGSFSVDLKRHLTWPDAAGDYDLFLWLADLTSDMVLVRKAAEPGGRPGATEDERPTRIALAKPSATASGPTLAAGQERGSRVIVGTGGPGRTSVIAYAIESGVVGWTTVGTADSSPISFSIDVARLLPKAGPRDRIYAFAIGGGKRSALLVLPPPR